MWAVLGSAGFVASLTPGTRCYQQLPDTEVPEMPYTEAHGASGRTPPQTCICHIGKLEPHSVSTEGTEKF